MAMRFGGVVVTFGFGKVGETSQCGDSGISTGKLGGAMPQPSDHAARVWSAARPEVRGDCISSPRNAARLADPYVVAKFLELRIKLASSFGTPVAEQTLAANVP